MARLAALLLIAVLATAAPPPLAAADAFLSVIEDLPLMPGLVEDADGAVNFETAGGRIVEVRASGAVKAGDVRSFYAGVLPQVGWQPAGKAGEYRRDSERLALKVEAGPSGAVVTFSIHPLGR